MEGVEVDTLLLVLGLKENKIKMASFLEVIFPKNSLNPSLGLWEALLKRRIISVKHISRSFHTTHRQKQTDICLRFKLSVIQLSVSRDDINLPKIWKVKAFKNK